MLGYKAKSVKRKRLINRVYFLTSAELPKNYLQKITEKCLIIDKLSNILQVTQESKKSQWKLEQILN